MTDEKKPTNYEQFVRDMDELDRAVALSDQLNDKRGGKNDEALKELRKYAYSVMPENARPENADELNGELFKEYLQLGQLMAQERAVNNFHDNLDSVVGEIPEKGLERLIRAEQVSKKVPAKYEDAARMYSAYLKFEELAKKYEDNNEISESDKKLVKGAAAREFADSEVKRIREENEKGGQKYSESLYSAVKNLAMRAAGEYLEKCNEDDFRKYAIEGLKAFGEEMKKAYEKIAEKKDIDIYDVTREAVKALARGSRKDFETAYRLVYAAEKDTLKLKEKDEEDEEEEELARAA